VSTKGAPSIFEVNSAELKHLVRAAVKPRIIAAHHCLRETPFVVSLERHRDNSSTPVMTRAQHILPICEV
jgi:hypothetical protein